MGIKSSCNACSCVRTEEITDIIALLNIQNENKNKPKRRAYFK